MSREVATCRPTDTVESVMAAMTRHRVRHMPVLDQGKLCGIVSIGDVVKSRLDDLELETSTLREAYMARPCTRICPSVECKQGAGTLRRLYGAQRDGRTRKRVRQGASGER